MKILKKNFFLMSQGYFNQKIRFLCQKVWENTILATKCILIICYWRSLLQLGSVHIHCLFVYIQRLSPNVKANDNVIMMNYLWPGMAMTDE